MNRREFLKLGGILSLTPAFAKSDKKFHFVLPKKPFKFYIKEGKLPGKRVLIIGGIHGNEYGGFTSSDILVDLEIKKGTLAILPRSNPESIYTDLRGYNGDMNRKFANLSKQDPDYYKVEAIKDFIKEFKPDVILSLHDGYGYYAKNRNDWGESIVIDETHYKNIDLITPVLKVHKELKKKGYNLPIKNTKTFHKNTHHLEQRMSLTYYCLKNHNVPAFCIEASKQDTRENKLKIHLIAIETFLKMYGVEVAPSLGYVLNHLDKFNKLRDKKVVLKVGKEKLVLNRSKTLYLPKKEIVFETDSRKVGVIPKGVNVNYNSFHYRHKAIEFLVKNDNDTLFKIKIKEKV